MKILIDSKAYVTSFMTQGDGDIYDERGNRGIEVQDLPEEEMDQFSEFANAYKYSSATKTVTFDYTKYESIVLDRLKQQLRIRREKECFSIINRGELWYDTLTTDQREELSVWYQAWLDVTETLTPPDPLPWL